MPIPTQVIPEVAELSAQLSSAMKKQSDSLVSSPKSEKRQSSSSCASPKDTESKRSHANFTAEQKQHNATEIMETSLLHPNKRMQTFDSFSITKSRIPKTGASTNKLTMFKNKESFVLSQHRPNVHSVRSTKTTFSGKRPDFDFGSPQIETLLFK